MMEAYVTVPALDMWAANSSLVRSHGRLCTYTRLAAQWQGGRGDDRGASIVARAKVGPNWPPRPRLGQEGEDIPNFPPAHRPVEAGAATRGGRV